MSVAGGVLLYDVFLLVFPDKNPMVQESLVYKCFGLHHGAANKIGMLMEEHMWTIISPGSAVSALKGSMELIGADVSAELNLFCFYLRIALILLDNFQYSSFCW